MAFFSKYAQSSNWIISAGRGKKSELFETTTYLAILLVTFLGWLSDPLNGCWWPPNRGSFVGSRRFHHLIMLRIHFLGSRWVSSLSVHLSWRSSVHQSFHMEPVPKNYTLDTSASRWMEETSKTDRYFFHQNEALNGRMLLGILVGKVSGREINKGSGKEHTDGIHLLKMRISV